MFSLVSVALLAASVQYASAGCCSGMTMSEAGLKLTESYEGLRQHVYDDVAGNPTVCYGHLVTPGEHFGSFVPLSECQSLLKSDLGTAESCVRRYTNVPLNNNQFDALVDFTFNLGCGAFSGSTLLRDLNNGNYAAVPGQMMEWDHAGGRVYAGLKRRRAAEGQLWGGSTPHNTPSGTPTENPVGQVCSGGSGKCIDTASTSCGGTLDHGLCGGGSNVLCCVENAPQTCAGDTGLCVNTDVTTCTGSILHNECPGASNVLCCVDAVGTSCDNGNGKCIDVDTTHCASGTLYGLCPGADNIRCCPGSSCDNGNGNCINVDTTTCEQSTLYGLCEGADNIRCCPESSDYYSDYAEEESSSSSKLSEGATVGIAAACIAVVLLVVGVAAVVLARSKSQQAAPATDIQEQLLDNEEGL